MLNILFLGDIFGKVGRRLVARELGGLRRAHHLDFVIANGENCAAGVGITPKIMQSLFDLGIDVLTGGNHIFQNKDILPVMNEEPRLLRPANFPPQTPGYGYGVFAAKSGADIAVINLQGRVFMDPIDCPFRTADELIARIGQDWGEIPIIVDFHAEATAEKRAMGYYLDGRVSAVIGTHTHVPTADETLLPQGTAYISDIGCCSALNSVIGVDIKKSIEFMTTAMPIRLTPQKGRGVLMGVLLQLDGKRACQAPQRIYILEEEGAEAETEGGNDD
jgi:metallophosphoesterase (TIGR00282 family)